MKTTKLLAVPALAAASLLALTGCIQMPPATSGNSGNTGTDTGTDSGATEDLAGTSWSGAIGGVVEPFGFTLNADGTVDITQWGDPTVLALDRLSASDRALFAAAAAPGQLARSVRAIPEPHGSWVDPIEREWTRRYGTA